MSFEDDRGKESNVFVERIELCPRRPVSTTLPPVDISYDDMEKVIRIKYGRLPLSFRRVAPRSDSVTCSFEAAGTLPVTIGLGPRVFDAPIPVKSVASARLDFLRTPPSSKPACKWATPYRGKSIAKDCIVGGTGDVLVRWHTPGFVEKLMGATVYNSGPLTYYARVSSSSTYAEAIQTIEPLLHVELTRHLGWIKPFYMIQEPPADIRVIDHKGRVTGMGKKGKVRQQIPGSKYVRQPHGYSAVFLADPDQRRYRVRVSGKPRAKYSLTLTKVYGFSAARRFTPEAERAGRLPRRGAVTFRCGPKACVR